MLASQVPANFPIPFANAAGAGYIRAIPQASQISITPGAASLTDGFPPLNFQPVASGGVPPFGQDMNGLMYQVTANIQWSEAGGIPVYNSSFSTAIGGYPNGAVLQSADGTGFWRSTVDNNTSNPDTGGANWLPHFFYGFATQALSNANVTLTAVQYAKSVIVLSGTLTANVNLIFPTIVGQWLIVNNTTGAFTIAAKTASGSGVILATAGAQPVWGDGTNIYAGVKSSQVTYSVTGLVGANNSSTPNTQYDLKADAVTVRNPSTGDNFTGINIGTLTVNAATAGPVANGRDQSAAFTASQWLYTYFIYSPSTNVWATTISASPPPTGPTLPTGYTAWAFCHANYFNSSSQLVATYVRGAWAQYKTQVAALTSGGATTSSAVSLTTTVPPNALEVRATVTQFGGVSSGAGNSNFTLTMELASGAGSITMNLQGAGTASSGNTIGGTQVTFANVGQSINYYLTVSAGSSPTASFSISGYKLPNGGE